jgi:hypothetical protein
LSIFENEIKLFKLFRVGGLKNIINAHYIVVVQVFKDLDFPQQSLRVYDIFEQIQKLLNRNLLLSGKMNRLAHFAIAATPNLLLYIVILPQIPFLLVLHYL